MSNRDLAANGQLIGGNDLWIAATSLAHGMPLVTRNGDHFKRVPGLEVIIGDSDWAKKIPVLDKIINEVTRREEAVKAVDIRFGEKIYVRK